MKIIKKLLFTGVVLFSTLTVSYGQISFSHSLGGSVYLSENVSAPGILYSPRLNFLELGDEITVSVGTHLGLGFSLNADSQGGGSGSFALDLPVVAEINFGQGANPDTQSSFGGFAGLGFGISKMGASDAMGDGYNDAAGVVINGGLRAIIRDKAVGLRVSYLLNIKKDNSSVLGVGLFYTFGDF